MKGADIFLSVIILFICLLCRVEPARSEISNEQLADPQKIMWQIIFDLKHKNTRKGLLIFEKQTYNNFYNLIAKRNPNDSLLSPEIINDVLEPKKYVRTAIIFGYHVYHHDRLSLWVIRIDRGKRLINRIQFAEFKPDATYLQIKSTFEDISADFIMDAERRETQRKIAETYSRVQTKAQEQQKQAIEKVIYGKAGSNSAGGLAYGSETSIVVNKPPRIAVASAEPEESDAQIISFPFATTRAQTKATQVVTFSGARANTVSYGVAHVSVPSKHKYGLIERPLSFSIFGFEYSATADDKRHFVLKNLTIQNKEDFFENLKQNNPEEILIFVHGFNTNFADASYRTAQIIYDMQYNGKVVLFSWASNGKVADYLYDRDSAYLARKDFVDFLDAIISANQGKRINILAHSMGNLLVMDALANNANSIRPLKISKLIMAAPDVDRDQFLKMLPDVQKITGSTTLYASSEDKALFASKLLARNVRAGDIVDAGPITIEGLETIDASTLGEELFGLNHNVFATTKNLMNDIRLLLKDMKPPRLSEIKAVPTPPNPVRYWKYVH